MFQSLETNSVQMNEMLFLHVFVNYIFKQLFSCDKNQFVFFFCYFCHLHLKSFLYHVQIMVQVITLNYYQWFQSFNRIKELYAYNM
jgi:hypothetical protein